MTSSRNVYTSLLLVIAGSTDTRHAKTLWQCDFFSMKIVSKVGLRDIFVLIFINVETRRVYISPSTYKPDEQWMVQQATTFIESTKTGGPKC